MRKGFVPSTRHVLIGLAFTAILLTASACAVRHTTTIAASQVPPPAREASTGELVDRVNTQSAAVRTLNATVDLAPTAGSIYSGVIKEYRDVKGFILVEKPAMIRMIGQAPVVRTNIFDMVSDGDEFRLYLPSKQKFIVGKTTFHRLAKNALESLRPQHILDALLFAPIDPARDVYYPQQDEGSAGQRFYILNILEAQPAGERGELTLKRRVWFDGATLDIVRVQFYGAQGSRLEDAGYSEYQDFDGVHYPTRIRVERPVEDYRLSITILKAAFNQPIDRDKFELKKPASAELVVLSERHEGEDAAPVEAGHGQ